MSDTIYILSHRVDWEQWDVRHVFTDKTLADATLEALGGDDSDYFIDEHQVSDRVPTVVHTYWRNFRATGRGRSSGGSFSHLHEDIPDWVTEALKDGKVRERSEAFFVRVWGLDEAQVEERFAELMAEQPQLVVRRTFGSPVVDLCEETVDD